MIPFLDLSDILLLMTYKNVQLIFWSKHLRTRTLFMKKIHYIEHI